MVISREGWSGGLGVSETGFFPQGPFAAQFQMLTITHLNVREILPQQGDGPPSSSFPQSISVRCVQPPAPWVAETAILSCPLVISFRSFHRIHLGPTVLTVLLRFTEGARQRAAIGGASSLQFQGNPGSTPARVAVQQVKANNFFFSRDLVPTALFNCSRWPSRDWLF